MDKIASILVESAIKFDRLDKAVDQLSKSLNNRVIAQRQYEELTAAADKLHNELINRTDGCDKLFTQLFRDAKDKGEAEDVPVDEITAKLDELSMGLLKLHVLRSLDEPSILKHELRTCKDQLLSLENVIREVIPDETIRSIDEIMACKPGVRQESHQEAQEEYTECTTTLAPYTSHKKKSTSYTLIKSSGSDIPMNAGYKVCYCEIPGRTLLYGTYSGDIRILNMSNDALEPAKCDMEIWDMICTAHNELVAINTKHDKIHLLNGQFKTLFKWPSHYDSRAICYLSQHFYILYSLSRDEGLEALICTIEVKRERFCLREEVVIPLEDEPMYMALFTDKKHVALVSHKLIYKVNLKNSSFTKHDISRYVLGACAVFIDGSDNVLVGDCSGKVHYFDPDFVHKEIISISGSVRDIAVIDGKLIITSKDNKFLVYS